MTAAANQTQQQKYAAAFYHGDLRGQPLKRQEYLSWWLVGCCGRLEARSLKCKWTHFTNVLRFQIQDLLPVNTTHQTTRLMWPGLSQPHQGPPRHDQMRHDRSDHKRFDFTLSWHASQSAVTTWQQAEGELQPTLKASTYFTITELYCDWSALEWAWLSKKMRRKYTI